MMSASEYTLYSREEYFRYLIERCHRAMPGDRIVLVTMEFRPDQPLIADVVEALCAAAQNGAHVTFMADAFSFMLKNGTFLGPMFFTKRDPKFGYGHFRTVISAMHTLRKSGVNCTIINRPSRPLKNPFRGRSHIKFATINDEVFIGGCNLSHPNLLDVMVKTTNKKLARYLQVFTDDVMRHKNVRRAMMHRDAKFKVDEHTTLLIDAGVKRQSLIYDYAFRLIKSARKKVYMTCQYFPNINLPAALAQAANRGVGVHLAYNHPEQHRTGIRGIQKRTLAYSKKRLPLSVFENQLDLDKNYLHAKILLSEKEAIIGSHNFVKMGVNLGTAEIALHSTAPNFISSARQWVQSL